MKTRTAKALSVALLPMVVGLSSCSSTAPVRSSGGISTVAACEPGVAGGQRIDTITETTTVVSIDRESRVVTLKAEDGSAFAVNVGPEAINFDQIREGSTVKATLSQSVVVYVADEGLVEGDAVGDVRARAAEGGEPGGLRVGVVQFSGTLMALDLVNRIATLQFSDGSVVTSEVRPDVDMTRYRVGQKVVFRVAGVAAIEVVKP